MLFLYSPLFPTEFSRTHTLEDRFFGRERERELAVLIFSGLRGRGVGTTAPITPDFDTTIRQYTIDNDRLRSRESSASSPPTRYARSRSVIS